MRNIAWIVLVSCTSPILAFGGPDFGQQQVASGATAEGSQNIAEVQQVEAVHSALETLGQAEKVIGDYLAGAAIRSEPKAELDKKFVEHQIREYQRTVAEALILLAKPLDTSGRFMRMVDYIEAYESLLIFWYGSLRLLETYSESVLKIERQLAAFNGDRQRLEDAETSILPSEDVLTDLEALRRDAQLVEKNKAPELSVPRVFNRIFNYLVSNSSQVGTFGSEEKIFSETMGKLSSNTKRAILAADGTNLSLFRAFMNTTEASRHLLPKYGMESANTIAAVAEKALETLQAEPESN